MMSKSNSRIGGMFVWIGVAGVGIEAALNVVALAYFESDAGEVFSPGWWSSWFSAYLVFGVFLVIGGALRLAGSSDG